MNSQGTTKRRVQKESWGKKVIRKEEAGKGGAGEPTARKNYKRGDMERGRGPARMGASAKVERQ